MKTYFKYFIGLILIISAAYGSYYFLVKKSVYQVSHSPVQADINLEVPEAPQVTTSSVVAAGANQPQDIGPQSPLANPPGEIRGIYLTAWTAGSAKRVDALIDFIKERNLNAVVIDIKDYSGFVSYKMDIPEVQASGAEDQIRIASPNALIKKLHDNGIYVIARITVFQDPILAKAHPEWALKNKNTGALWRDNRGLAWMDADGQGAWDYTIAIAKDVLSRGFDEVNFDYLRFPSDGNLNLIQYPFWNGKISRHKIIRKFFSYLREHMGAARISADLFGLSTSSNDDLGIGQVIVDAYPYFDFVSPMVYPSHYATGYLGFKNPALYPYEVVNFSMGSALKKLQQVANPTSIINTASTTSTSSAATAILIASSTELNQDVFIAKLRPWLQVFDLGAVYTPDMVNKEIKAVNNALASSTEDYAGWLLWDPRNIYAAYQG